MNHLPVTNRVNAQAHIDFSLHTLSAFPLFFCRRPSKQSNYATLKTNARKTWRSIEQMLPPLSATSHITMKQTYDMDILVFSNHSILDLNILQCLLYLSFSIFQPMSCHLPKIQYYNIYIGPKGGNHIEASLERKGKNDAVQSWV